MTGDHSLSEKGKTGTTKSFEKQSVRDLIVKHIVGEGEKEVFDVF